MSSFLSLLLCQPQAGGNSPRNGRDSGTGVRESDGDTT